MILEVPTEELDRVSLYDIARKKREESSTPITRLLYTVYFSDSALQKIDIEAVLKQQVHITKYIFKIKNVGDQLGLQPTGYLMIRGLFSLHLLEAEGAFITTWIKNLWEEFQIDKAVYQIINIITFTEDNPTRYYSTNIIIEYLINGTVIIYFNLDLSCQKWIRMINSLLKEHMNYT